MAKTEPEYKCPKCGGHELVVQISKWAIVEFSEDNGQIETTYIDEDSPIGNGDNEYDMNSAMMCLNEGCGHHGNMDAFENPAYDEDAQGDGLEEADEGGNPECKVCGMGHIKSVMVPQGKHGLVEAHECDNPDCPSNFKEED